MTTVAYNHKDKEIAFDSRLTLDGVIMSDEHKKDICANENVFFMAGKQDECDEFAKNFSVGVEHSRSLECCGVMFDGSDFYTVVIGDDKVFRMAKLTYNYAIGSGDCFALSAMDFGRTAKEAVEYAATKDCYTGGKINSFRAHKV